MKTLSNICEYFNCVAENNSTFVLKTNIGTLRITDFKDETFIPIIFERDFNLKEFLKVSHDNTINPNSFKWNLHSTDKKFNLERLKSRLDFIKRNFIITNIENYLNYGMCEYNNTISDKDMYNLGDVVINSENEIGVIIQIHSSDEFRCDMFGNCSSNEIRPALISEINLYRPNIYNEGTFKH